jgi:hypothetical protein
MQISSRMVIPDAISAIIRWASLLHQKLVEELIQKQRQNFLNITSVQVFYYHRPFKTQTSYWWIGNTF